MESESSSTATAATEEEEESQHSPFRFHSPLRSDLGETVDTLLPVVVVNKAVRQDMIRPMTKVGPSMGGGGRAIAVWGVEKGFRSLLVLLLLATLLAVAYLRRESAEEDVMITATTTPSN